MRERSSYVCQQCGYSQIGWAGKCPECDSWGSLVETVESEVKSSYQRAGKGKVKSGEKPVSLTSVPSKRSSRISTKISELDRVLGGGLVAGQVVLIAGEPGIGKSTLLIEVADKLAKGNNIFLYISGEESAQQIKIRAQRLGIKNPSLKLSEDTDIDSTIDTILTFKGESLKGVVVDSIQTMTTSDLSGMAGSVGQVRESAFRLTRVAKERAVPTFLVGHVTKEGAVAGPAVLMHIVDTVLWFEGDKSLTLRILRAVKNRFGPIDEVGVFSMEEVGLTSVANPEKIFLSKSRSAVPGSVTCSVFRGSRPILVEVQSLVVPTKMAFAKRIAQGIDTKRFELLLAVLTRRVGLPLADFDCFANVAGGISVKGDPSVDLALCLSVASAFYDKPIEAGTVAIGEIGLLGDIREVVAQEKRVREAKRLGFRNIITNNEVRYLPQAIRKYLKHTGLTG